MRDDTETIEYWDIYREYIIGILNGYRTEYPDFYRELERLSAEQFAVNLVYDYRQNRKGKGWFGRVKPLRSLSAVGFIREYDTFDPLDKFSLSLANGKTTVYHQCYADVMLLVVRNQFYSLCDVAMPQKREDTLLFSLAEKYGYTPEDKTAVKELFDKIVPTNSKPPTP